MQIKFERANAPAWVRPVIPLAAILVTFIITSVLILWAKANPFTAYYYFLIAPLSNQVSALEVLVKGTPLLRRPASGGRYCSRRVGDGAGSAAGAAEYPDHVDRRICGRDALGIDPRLIKGQAQGG
jgi:hypothetical protein